MDEDMRKIVLENQRLLLENLELSRKNARKIAHIHSGIKRSRIWKFLYWLIIIVIGVWGYVILKPRIDSVMESYNKLQDQISETKELIEQPKNFIQNNDLINSLLN